MQLLYHRFGFSSSLLEIILLCIFTHAYIYTVNNLPFFRIRPFVITRYIVLLCNKITKNIVQMKQINVDADLYQKTNIMVKHQETRISKN